MVLRSMVHRWIRTHDRDRRSGPPLGKFTRYALFFAIGCAVWLSFKKIEPAIFPVIEDFKIVVAKDLGDKVAISGTMDKVRDCEFIEVVGYSGEEHVAVVFNKYPGAPVVSRLVRKQTYGPWLLIPKVPEIELYAHHICSTGKVTTKLFQGAIVGVSP